MIIDKPAGKTSHDVVAEVKRVLKAEKVGHTGTLDPLATGVLPIMINEGTKLSPFLVHDTKEYRVTVRFGITTDTLDITGNILEKRDINIAPEEVRGAIDGLRGVRQQVPPRYSAVKFQGKPLYSWARRGVPVTPVSRTVEIFDVHVDAVDMPEATFSVTCSKGTYIRSLCADIGEVLGCGAALAVLRRTRSGSFCIADALALEGLGPEEKKDRLTAALIPPEEALAGLKTVSVDEALAKKLRDGYQVVGSDLAGDHIPFLDQGDMVRFVCGRTGLVAVVEMLSNSGDFASMDKTVKVARTLRVFHPQHQDIE